eukprot:6477276-Amphidinium_carterae.1
MDSSSIRVQPVMSTLRRCLHELDKCLMLAPAICRHEATHIRFKPGTLAATSFKLSSVMFTQEAMLSLSKVIPSATKFLIPWSVILEHESSLKSCKRLL